MTTDSTRSRILEVMARAMGAPVEGPEGEKWGEYPPFKRFAELALTAYESHLEAEGMAVVSKDQNAALMDHEFHAGTRAGWDAAHADNPAEAFAALDKTQKERLSMLSASPYGKASMQEASAERAARSEQIPPGKEESK